MSNRRMEFFVAANVAPGRAADLAAQEVRDLRDRYAEQLSALRSMGAKERAGHMMVINDIEWLLYAVEALSRAVHKVQP